MKIRNLVLLVFVISIFAFSCKNNQKKKEVKEVEPGTTILSGQLKNYKNNIIILKTTSSTDTIYIKNDAGDFLKTIKTDFPIYVDFINDNNNLILYLLPKDELIINADCFDFNKTVKFKGKSQPANEYLNSFIITIKNAGINSENFIYSSKFETFKTSLQNLISQLETVLNDFSKKHNKDFEEFINLEIERIKMLKASLMISYYNPILRTDKKNADFEKEIESAIYSVDMNNSKLLMFSDFKNFGFNIINYKMNIELRNSRRELKSAPEYTEMFFKYAKEIYTEKDIKEEMFYVFIKEFLNYYGPESVYEAYLDYKSFTSSREHLSELNNIFEEFSKTAPGKECINWKFPDKNGKVYSLSDFKGKYVYIDVWASWCGPCRTEIPYLKVLKEKFKNKNIAIIGISVDENRNDWLNFLESQNLAGIQLYAGGWNNDLVNFFKINGIPRFILLDKEGKIINANAERPSGNIEKVLNSLEGI
ncbi:MAG: TlpA disulfide reductase family protein [Bacteroidales bacterium]|jgi:thiol-disulfide isomerase/thioredoxin|nr:TlpA disulfide reductase family protein [Bacteroidales bacterium]HOL96992.1 TlpA disulfide reductase family protein [Bacteroidales bacterium]HOM36291.1 TlpA disulfide reductase family protein [Bacteroidales bacterium]HPD23785.1 TlpA disulfide reductase family protein [Bacteroidales bacterium]HRS98677.1 TlpA disulfide reductase family protein [Bacteroidales bacterium]